MRWQRLYNPLVRVLLRSPLGKWLGRSLLLLTYTGRRSGQRYTIPVGYVRNGDTLVVMSPRTRVWWRNLRSGAPVSVRLAGRELRGRGTLSDSPEATIDGLLTVLRAAPRYQRALGVRLSTGGKPADPAALEVLAQRYVVVRIAGLEP
ncbi:MAG: nitroreductase family deazaflavin-dependent oxidoreductase [Chloroflexota bacterium]|nr:nitroreductase family deazaflavin-dependent oxidoreductase [Chloroflexota bacterium]